MNKILWISASSFISALLAVWLFIQFGPKQEIIVKEVIHTPFVKKMKEVPIQRSYKSAPTNFIDAAQIGTPAVVFIRSLQKAQKNKILGDQMYGATGSGVIISSDGYIATNNHVVQSAEVIEVMLNDNREFTAKLIGTDPNTDLALLKIEEHSLPFLEFGDSDSLLVGEWVLAIGNPFRLQSTVTAGIVSAKGRNIQILEQQGIESFIQTDAAVNPGNSGGALVNTSGDLVGINTAIMTYTGRYEGFSFAIPSNLAKKVIFDIKEYGAVQRGWLGVTITNIDSKRADDLGLKEVGGVFVERLNRGEAAFDAGLESGDVIISVNGVKTMTTPQFMEQIGRYRPGDLVEMEYVRKREMYKTNVTLRNQINSTDLVAVRKDKILTTLGFELRDLDKEEKDRLKTKGIYVVSVYRGSKIERTNMDPGYIITKVNEKEISSVQEFVDLLEKHEGMVVLEGFYENYPGEFPYAFSLE